MRHIRAKRGPTIERPYFKSSMHRTGVQKKIVGTTGRVATRKELLMKLGAARSAKNPRKNQRRVGLDPYRRDLF